VSGNRKELRVTYLHLVRHGESEWHLENRYAGQTDIVLTNRGHIQAESLIAWAREIKPSVIYSSDLIRAIETALPMSRSIGLDLRIDARLREVNFGEIEGLTPEEMSQKYSELRKEFILYPADTRMPYGESGVEALERALPGVIEVLSEIGDGSAIIVCHGTLMRLIACWMLGIDVNQYRRVFPVIPNGGRISLKLNHNESYLASPSRAGLIELRGLDLDTP
jgi:broad specificity phosphatase PhoE